MMRSSQPVQCAVRVARYEVKDGFIGADSFAETVYDCLVTSRRVRR